jgi:ADP-dependent NAD(P)H-hydrate dehydratase / NAD(P)H-hydrate epimerase
MMQKVKVVSSKSMAEIEKIAIEEGCDELLFMEEAAASIVDFLEDFIAKKKLKKIVTILAGKGNNGGDGFVAGVKLLEKGYTVKVISIYPIKELGSICRKQQERFSSLGGEISPICAIEEGVILDALVGTGFKGGAKGELAEGIFLANHAQLPIISVDIPSGLCGSTGKVETVAIEATATVYLELPKIGFFLQQGPDHVGLLAKGTFGLPPVYIEKVEPTAFLVEKEGIASLLPSLSKTRNKYLAGYVIALAGSPSMMGAGTLLSHAALKSGAGIVRWFYPEEGKDAFFPTLPEVIRSPITISLAPLFKEMERGSCLVVGPGMGREKIAFKQIKQVLSKANLPVVIDADALFFLSKNPSFHLPLDSVLTPHMGEMKRLLGKEEEDFLSACQRYVDGKNVTLLLKGSPNFLFRPQEPPSILPFGNAGMATAGSGDVLCGVIAAFLAQGLSPKHAALLGCFMHGLSGDLAAKDKTQFSMTASDLVEYLEKAFSYLLKD